MVQCHYVHCCLLQCVHSFFTTSHCTLCWFCVNMSTAAFYSLSVPNTVPSVGSVSLSPLLPSTVCQYLTQYRLLVLCHYINCCLLQSVQCLSVHHTEPSVGSVSLCPLLPSTVCPQSVSTSHSTVCWFCVTISTAAFYSLSNVCRYITLNRLLVVC